MHARRRTGWHRPVGALLSCVLATAYSGCSDGASDSVDCDVTIVGGGAGGLHTAFRLAPTLGRNVCVVEKESALGGRIHDVALDDADPNAVRVGTGARRVMETQQVLFALATELGITMETPGSATDLIGARSKYSFVKDDLRVAYANLLPNPDPNTDQETWQYDVLRKGPGRGSIVNQPDLRAYIRANVGNDGYEFLRDMSRFRADFEYPLDARGYMDYLDEEWDVCCTPSYPVGGMSTFIRGMETRTAAMGARIYTGQQVTAIEKGGQGFRYRVRTPGMTIRTNKLVIAVSPYWLNQIGGDIVAQIKDQRPYQDIIGVRVVTITQWWNEAWWAQIHDPGKTQDNQVWRAWTTDQCLNFIEIPQEPYAAAAKVTRSVYDDDIRCVQFWEELSRRGVDVVEKELNRQLTALFNNNGASQPSRVTIPAPRKTHVQVWPDAWHWLAASASMTNYDLMNWAVEPLRGEEVALVGEAYNPQRSGWSDAAYKSSIKLLNSRYGQSLAGLTSALRTASGHAGTSPTPPRVQRSDGGH